MKKIKYFYLFIALLFSLAPLLAQREHLIISRSGESFAEIDMSSRTYTCKSELMSAADDFAASLDLSGGQSFKVIVHSIYPMTTYVDEEQGLNVNEKITYDKINAEYDNYLLFIVINGNKGKRIKLYSNLDSNVLTASCKISQDQIRAHLQNELNEKSKSSDVTNYYCILAGIVKEYKNKIDNSCQLSQEEEEQWYVENGFDIFDVTGKLEFAEKTTNSKENVPRVSSNRNCFSIIDLGKGRYIKNGVEYSLSYLLEGTDATDYPALYVFTSNWDDSSVRQAGIDVFNNSNPCNIGFWINIPKRTVTGKQKLYMKTSFYGKQTQFNPHTIESLWNEFTFLNGPIYANLPTWDFQFKEWKDEIIKAIDSYGINYVHIESNKVAAGFIAGFADSALRDIKFLAQVLGAIERFNRDLNVLGIFSAVSFNTLLTKQSLKDVVINQTVNSYLAIYELKEIGVAFANFLKNPDYAIHAFMEGVATIIVKSLFDLTFQNGSFDAGYTAGQAFYLYLGVPLAIKGAKALKTFLGKPKNFLSTYAKEVGETAGAAKIKEALAKAGVGVYRHPNWLEIADISNKIEARMPHVDYLDFKGNGFQGCHTQNAMNQYLANNPGWTGGFIDANGNAISLLDNVPIEAYPWVKNINGNVFTKINGAQKTINGVQYGKASFFPKNWSTAKLKAEVEYAVSNNHGLLNGNTYKGFSTDGTVEIWFYYNTSNGSIISFFPKVN